MNLLGQFWRYVTKVFDLPCRLRAVRDTTICEDYQERRGEDWCSLVYGNRSVKHL